MSSKTILVVVLALVFGLSAAMLVHWARRNQPDSSPKKVKLVVAARDIQAQSILDATALKVGEFPADMQPVDAFPAEEIGKLTTEKTLLTRVDIKEGEAITPRVLSDKPALKPLIEPNFIAQAIPVEAKEAIGGWLRPGDYVDVQFSYRRRGRAEEHPDGGALTKMLLRNVKVLAVGDVLSSEVAAATEGGVKKSIRLQHVTLMVTPTNANKLTLASQTGYLSLALRGPNDEENEGEPQAVPQDATLVDLLNQPGVETQATDTLSQNQLADLERKFEERLLRSEQRMQEKFSNQGITGVPSVGPVQSPDIEPSPSFLRLIMIRGSRRDERMVRLPAPKQDRAFDDRN